MIKALLSILMFTLIYSCGNPSVSISSNQTETKKLIGFYERAGTIQFINNVAIDTISTVEGFRATKLFLDGFHIWIDNSLPNSDQKSPWGSGQGIFGKYKIESDSLHEIVQYGFGGRAGLEKTGFPPELPWASIDTIENTVTWKAAINYNNDKFSQFGNLINEDNTDTKFAEYYIKVPDLFKSEIDGVWKRVSTIEYVNNIPVDTIPINNDEYVQYKFFHNGKFMLFYRDLTNEDSSSAEYYGNATYGNFEYKDGILTERIDYGTKGMESFFKALPDKDKYGETYISFDLNLKENSYSQKWAANQETNESTSEYYIKIN